MQSLSRIGLTFSFVLILLCQTSLLTAGERRSCCPKCSTPCVLKVEEGTETKHCWKVEEKTVCIPRVTFSWQWPFQKKNCGGASCDQAGCSTCCKPPKIARSRKVCVLVKHEYECPVCKYSWEPKETPSCAQADCAAADCTAADGEAGSMPTSNAMAKTARRDPATGQPSVPGTLTSPPEVVSQPFTSRATLESDARYTPFAPSANDYNRSNMVGGVPLQQHRSSETPSSGSPISVASPLQTTTTTKR